MKLSNLSLVALLGSTQAATIQYQYTLKKTPDHGIHALTQAPQETSKILADTTYADIKSSSNSTIPILAAPSKTQETFPIEVLGNKFFNSVTKEQFFLKGIAYQPSRATNDAIAIAYDGLTIIDPMADSRLCMRDLPYLASLGVNTVRAYAIDADKDHDECFNAYAEAGIYVIADLSEPDLSVNRKAPAWDTDLYQRYTSVVDALHKYNNLLGFFAGNEVTNDKTNTNASPFVKSAIRDTKQYIKDQGYRQIPVGYASNDDADTRADLAQYFSCGEAAADFYGINMYEWCGHSSFYTSGYKERTEEFKNSAIPVFFSEFGCNLERPRPFTEVDALFSHMMTDVWSGGLAYMYFEEPNEYGVVLVDSDGNIIPLADYHNLQKAYLRNHPIGVSMENYKSKMGTSKAKSCSGTSSSWKATSVLPQSPDAVKCDCMESLLECKLANSVKKSELSKIFEYGCGEVDCSEISNNGYSGQYGSFADCSTVQKASYVLNEVYKKQGSKTDGCDFDGMALLSHTIASQDALRSKVTLSGKTCADFMDFAKSNKKVISEIKSTHNTSYNSTHGDKIGKPEENRASQQRFYENTLRNVGMALVAVGLITFLF